MDGSRSRQTETGGPTQSVRLRKRSSDARDRSVRGRSRRRPLGAAIETLEKRNLLTYAIDLFADINQLGVSSDINLPSGYTGAEYSALDGGDKFVQVGNESFFVANDGIHGSELWKTDGSASNTVMVKDLLPGPDSSEPYDLVEMNGKLFFTALDDDGETDLWKSDGTESGTVKVFDTEPAGVYVMMGLTVSKDLAMSTEKLFFIAEQEVSGYELWVSDGTSDGTKLVKDINPDFDDLPQELTDVNGELFFTSYSSYDNGRELWKSDGTEPGTVLVADLGIGPGEDGELGTEDDYDSFSSFPSHLTELDGVLYFAAEDFTRGVELFRYDSNAAEPKAELAPELNLNGSSDPRQLTPFKEELYFAATDGTNGRQLYKYKSGDESITFVADTTGGLGDSDPRNFAVVGEDLYFAANGSLPLSTVSATTPILTADNSRVSSGRYAGIVGATTSGSAGLLSSFNEVANFNATPQDSTSSGSGNTTTRDDGPGWAGPAPTTAIPFPNSPARPGDPGVGLTSIEVGDLYVEDIGSEDLTTAAWEWTISDEAGLSNISFAGFASGNEFNSFEGEAYDEGLLFELFLNGSSTPKSIHTVTGDGLDNWFATRSANNVGLSDPGGATITTATVRVSVGNEEFRNYPSAGNEAFVVNATLSADLSAETTQVVDAGVELHKTNGTTEGTVLVKDIVPMGSSNPRGLTEAGGKLFFSADDVTGDGRELWVSDGMENGTMQVVDSLPGVGLGGAPLDGDPALFGEVDEKLVFTTTNTSRDRELWLSGGTESTTDMLVNINPATGYSNVSDLVPFDTDIYFVADDGINGETIWRADTVAGTVEMIVDVSPASTDKISTLAVYSTESEQVVFYNNSLGVAGGVYITTPQADPDNPVFPLSIVQLSDRSPIELDDQGTRFVIVNELIFFVVDDGENGRELWKSDGTSTATMVDAGFLPGPAGSSPTGLTAFDNHLYFSADTSADTPIYEDVGRELFKTDGDEILLVTDIRSGTSSSDPQELTVSGSLLYFSADNGSSDGRELWKATMDGAVPVKDIRPGGGDSNPRNLTDVDGTLYFSANNGSNGFEPYRSDGAEESTVQIANLNPGGANSNPDGFLSFNNQVYFSASDGTHGEELWKTNVNSSGVGTTTLVSDIRPGPGGSEPVPLYDAEDHLLLSAAGTLFDDREMWSTDGGDLTLLVEDLYPPEFFGSDPKEITEIGGKLYFAATNGTFGREMFVLEEVPPSIVDVIINGDVGEPVVDPQRSTLDRVTVVFDGNVDVPLDAISVKNRDTDATLDNVNVNSRFESGKTYVELTFDSGPSVIDRDSLGTTGLRNSLADGNYELTIEAAKVSSPVSGEYMAEDYHYGASAADSFFRQFGDVDGDRDVDGQDYGLFAMSFLQPVGSPGYREDLDFDGDGDVDGQDYARFGRSLMKRLDFS